MSEQLNFERVLYPQFKIKQPIRLIELFAGIGAQAKALERLGVDFEHYKVVENDKFAIKSYNAIHGTNFIPLDIKASKGADLKIIDDDKYSYILTYSFPCQDLSIAGKQKGMSKGDNTRSGLLWEVERILNECEKLPQVLLMENVVQVHSKKNMFDFEKWCEFLKNKGYSNFYSDLNSKDYGTPQNRKRCYMVSIKGDCAFSFPDKIPLTEVMQNRLELTVDDKYILSDKAVKYVTKSSRKKFNAFNPTICSTIMSNYNNLNGTFVSCHCGGVLCGENIEKQPERSRRVYLTDGLCPTLTSCTGGNQQIKIEYDEKIRKLTPKECFRLMDFDDEDFEKCKSIKISDTQLYKQAGNSIVVSVLEAIFKELI